MITQKLPSIASGVLTISTTAIKLRDAIRAADSPTSDNFEFLDGVNFAYITVDANNVRYSVDGNTPSATVGALARAGDFILLSGLDLEKLTFIRQGGVDATLTVVALAKQDEPSGSPLQMSPAATVTVDTEFPTAAAITDNFANPTTTSVMAMGMLWDSATWDRAPGDSTNGMLVNLGANNDVTVTGTVTANAGTNLNTSLLALEAGNLATILARTPALGTALMAASSPITLATDDTQYGAVGAASDVDGNVHGQLRYIGEAVDGLETDTATIAGDTTSIDGKTPALGTALMAASVPVTLATNDVVSAAFKAEDAVHTTGDKGLVALAVRKDTASQLAGTDGDYSVLETNSTGHVHAAEGFAPQAEDNTNGVIATQNKPLAVTTYAWSVDRSTALEASSISKASAGVLRSISGRVDSTHATGTYYILVMNSATLPADGAVTTLVAPLKIQHVTGTDSFWSMDMTMNGVYASAGIVWCLSTSEFSKVISGAYASATALFI